MVKNWDAVIIGGGIIGLSSALELRKSGAQVLVLDRTEPGRESSWAAAGMIAHCDPHIADALCPLADASAEFYPEYIHELQDEAQSRIDFRRNGTVAFFAANETPRCPGARPVAADADCADLEPHLSYRENAWWLPESSVDPRMLLAALLKATRHREVEFATGSAVTAVEVSSGRVSAVKTEKATYRTPVAINCAGAWAGQIPPLALPARPVKGHMLCVVFPQHTPGQQAASADPFIHHVIRSPEVYVVPRTDGRLLIGSTTEEAGFDKRVDPEIIQTLHQQAANLVPQVGEARIIEAWTGLRPGTPDDLPILGATRIPGYFVATGHYRDGIMLAPITARIIAKIVLGQSTAFDLEAFSPHRF